MKGMFDIGLDGLAMPTCVVYLGPPSSLAVRVQIPPLSCTMGNEVRVCFSWTRLSLTLRGRLEVIFKQRRMAHAGSRRKVEISARAPPNGKTRHLYKRPSSHGGIFFLSCPTLRSPL